MGRKRERYIYNDDGTIKLIRCSMCKEYREPTEFGVRGKYHSSMCKKCSHEYTKRAWKQYKENIRHNTEKKREFVRHEGGNTYVQCRICNEWKTDDNYFISKNGSYQRICKKCARVYRREYQRRYSARLKKLKEESLMDAKKILMEEVEEKEKINPHEYMGRYVLINPLLRKEAKI